MRRQGFANVTVERVQKGIVYNISELYLWVDINSSLAL